MPTAGENEDAPGRSPTMPRPAVLNRPVVVTQPRDPGTFSGSDGKDVEDWLQLYERVSSSNYWDPTLMLANIIFYLTGTAQVWFLNHEQEITSWDVCKQKLIDLFGKPIGRRRAAQKELACRAQTCTESYVTYIQDVLALCRKVDDNMPEAEKVAHILKGIADDAFTLLVFKSSSTVQDVINECRRFEEAKSRRITPSFTRLPNTAATSTCEDLRSPPVPAASDDLVRIVRREIEAASPVPLQVGSSDDTRATVSLIQTVVRQELANAGLQTLCPVSRPDYRPPRAPELSRGPYVRPRFQNTAEWRTSDDRPICFSCRRVGHISRHCGNVGNWQPWSSYRYARRPAGSPRAPFHNEDDNALQSWPARPNRSPSPSSHRPRSPMRRRSPSPSCSRRSSEN